ncbi:hypothetical protein FRC09_003103 [Ceratobasidium sp. 395]|nr:hypothetical protein FRC09_003103 [Ceratobasidium sp. 395]
MPVYNLLPSGKATKYSPLLRKAVAEMLAVIHRHNERAITLRRQALFSFAEGCAHYLFSQISEKTHDETVQQLILALLRLYLATETEGFYRLRYIITLIVASSAAVAGPYGQVPTFSSTDETSTNRGARLFSEYTHRNTGYWDRYSTSAQQLLYFGLLGVSHLLPFASIDSQFTSLLFSSPDRGPEDPGIFPNVWIKTIPDDLTWDRLRMGAGLACLERVSELNGSFQAENTIAEYLQVAICDPCDIAHDAGPDQAELLNQIRRCSKGAASAYETTSPISYPPLSEHVRELGITSQALTRSRDFRPSAYEHKRARSACSWEVAQ